MTLRRELAKLGALFRRRKPVDDLAEEIRSHLEMEEQENRESGMTPEEAHYAALRRSERDLGAREEQGNVGMEFRRDALAGPSLRPAHAVKEPGLTAVAVLPWRSALGRTRPSSVSLMRSCCGLSSWKTPPA